MRAAPGSASETVGFSSVGEPSVLTRRVLRRPESASASSLDLLSRSRSLSSSLPSSDLAVALGAADDLAGLRLGAADVARASAAVAAAAGAASCRRCRCSRAWAWPSRSARASAWASRWPSASASAWRPARGRRRTRPARRSAGSATSWTERARRHVDGELDALAVGQLHRRGGAAPPRQGDHDRVQGGGGKRDEQRPTSHVRVREPSLAVSARMTPHAPVAPRVRGRRTVLADCGVFNLCNG